MQIISHKNNALTICQKFFIEKSLELLYLGSIDSYRVRLNNPKSILEELRYCLQEFEIGRIKHFHTIKTKEKEKKTIIDEAILLMNYEPNYLTFSSITPKYLKQLLKDIDEHNYKRIIFCIDILLKENPNYLTNVIIGLEQLISANNSSLDELEKIDKALNILFSELISKGYAKGFLYKFVYGVFVNSLINGHAFDDHFANFKQRIAEEKINYQVVFRIDTTQKVYDSISAIQHSVLTLSDNINEIQLAGSPGRELSAFNAPASARKYLKCDIEATDYLTALKRARSVISEYLDVINLGLADEFLQIHQRALVIDTRSPERANFQNNVNILDGKYRVTKDHYLEFTNKLPAILSNDKVASETKEKIKSAIRYLRLGNQSTEVEHKFINYWIGLEYLFSNYESQSTILRIKEHFINAHSLAYVKRNVYSLNEAFKALSQDTQALITAYNPIDESYLKEELFYTEVGQHLFSDYPLLAYRTLKLKKWFFKPNKPANAADYLNYHRSNLEIHFTRIYRLRNEIIHDAATNTNNEQIASNLRYYLTFILNELIDFHFAVTTKDTSIEDYFILNEIKIGNIENTGFSLSNLLDVACSIDFIS